MGRRDLPDMYARAFRRAVPRASADISCKSLLPMLNMLCNNSGTQKICPNYLSLYYPFIHSDYKLLYVVIQVAM